LNPTLLVPGGLRPPGGHTVWVTRRDGFAWSQQAWPMQDIAEPYEPQQSQATRHMMAHDG